MSSLAFSAAPIENPMPRAKRKGAGDQRPRNQTLKHRPATSGPVQTGQTRQIRNMIDKIHGEVGSGTPDDGAPHLAAFQPLDPPSIDYDFVGSHDPNVGGRRSRTPTRHTMARSGTPGDTHGGPTGLSALAPGEYAQPENYLSAESLPLAPTPSSPIAPSHTPAVDSAADLAAAANGGAKAAVKHLHGDKEELMRKLNYMIALLEAGQDERTGHVTEEVLLYSFLGIFIIFVVDSFARAGKYVR